MPQSSHHAASGATTAAPREGLDAKTLFIAAAASAAAAYACSKIWAPGTLASAAFTPVLIALIKEALAKPTAVVARAVPVRGVVRSARAQGAQQQPLESDPTAPGEPAARVAQPGEIQYHQSSGGGRRRGWRVAIVTGLLGFLVCAVVFTVPELMAGGSAAGGGRETTIFGGGDGDREPAVKTPKRTTTQPAQTVPAPPEETVTQPAPPVTGTPPPAETGPAQPLPETDPEPPVTEAVPPAVEQPPG